MKGVNKNSESTWGEVPFFYNEKRYDFPNHRATGEIYNLDPKLLIRFKCIALTIGTPLISIVRSIASLAQAFFMCLRELYHYLDNQPIECHAIAETAYDSLRALKYGSLMTMCAFFGIFSPYSQRQQYGKYEREYNNHLDGSPHRDRFYLAICFQPLGKMEKDTTVQLKTIERLNKYIFYIYDIKEKCKNCAFRELFRELIYFRHDLYNPFS